MKHAITRLLALEPKFMNWYVMVRVILVWDIESTFIPRRVISTEMVLMDSEMWLACMMLIFSVKICFYLRRSVLEILNWCFSYLCCCRVILCMLLCSIVVVYVGFKSSLSIGLLLEPCGDCKSSYMMLLSCITLVVKNSKLMFCITLVV